MQALLHAGWPLHVTDKDYPSGPLLPLPSSAPGLFHPPPSPALIRSANSLSGMVLDSAALPCSRTSCLDEGGLEETRNDGHDDTMATRASERY